MKSTGNVSENIQKINILSDPVEKTLNSLVSSVCKELDEYVNVVNSVLQSDSVVTNEDLGEIILNLTTLLYYVVSKQEQFGIKQDVSVMMFKEVYNKHLEEAVGTVQTKAALSELASQEEELISLIITRAYKLIKGKVDSAYELVTSAKKVLSIRDREMELSISSKYTSKRSD